MWVPVLPAGSAFSIALNYSRPFHGRTNARKPCSLADWARAAPPTALTLLVGPEGGFSEEEESAAVAAGALPLHMGARVLRTETAGIAACAVLQALWGG